MKHILIIGAGFAGLECCKRLAKADCRVTLVDWQNHHLFQPLLYQVATAGLSAPEIAQPVRSILRDQPNATVLMDEAVEIDLAAKRVTLRSGTVLTGDWLVLAMGVQTGWFGHTEWAAHAHGLKSLADAMRIRAQVLRNFELAEATGADAAEGLLTSVVVGGGPTGVEMAGALAELSRKVLARDFRRTDPAKAHVILVEGGPRLLAAFPEDMSEYTRIRLEKMGVKVMLSAAVSSIEAGQVTVGGQTIRAGMIVWAAGVEAPAITRSLGVPVDRAGRVLTGADCSVPGHAEVFVLGDLAAVTDAAGVRVPGLCPAAIQMGRHAAKVIRHTLENAAGPRPEFRYFDKGIMATIGRSTAVALSGKMKLKGFTAWLAWLFVHLLFLIGFRNRLFVFLQWVYSYTTWRRGARIIVDGPQRDRES